LHRLFQRHQISRLLTAEGTKLRQRFRSYPLGYVHIDLAEVWTQAGRLYLFVAIDRVSKFAFAELHERATRRIAAEFLRRLIERVPYRIHTVLTDNGFQFTPTARRLERCGDSTTAGESSAVSCPCLRLGLCAAGHRASAHEIQSPLDQWLAKRLKSLGGLTPFERICQLWTEQPERFRLNPIHTCRDRTSRLRSLGGLEGWIRVAS
jgi:integrase-like protein